MTSRCKRKEAILRAISPQANHLESIWLKKE